MTYIKKGCPIPDDENFQQVFYYEPSTRGTGITYKTIDLRLKSVINEMDKDIVQLLYHFSMARIDQICKAIGVGEPSLVKKRLDDLVYRRIINKFMISDTKERFADDAEVIYCMDFGGLPIIEHFTKDQNTLSWNIDKVVFPAVKVNKKIMALDFFIRVKTNPYLTFYEPEPLMVMGRNKCYPSAVFGLTFNNIEREFILETFREEEILYSTVATNSKVNRISTFLEEGTWDRVFRGEKKPLLFLFCESDACAIEVAKICKATQIDNFRIITCESMKFDLSKAFYSIEERGQELTLKPTVNKAFVEPKTK